MTRTRLIALAVAGADVLLILVAVVVAREAKPLALLALVPTFAGLAYIWFPARILDFIKWWPSTFWVWPDLREADPKIISLAGWAFLALISPTMTIMAAFDLL